MRLAFVTLAVFAAFALATSSSFLHLPDQQPSQHVVVPDSHPSTDVVSERNVNIEHGVAVIDVADFASFDALHVSPSPSLQAVDLQAVQVPTACLAMCSKLDPVHRQQANVLSAWRDTEHPSWLESGSHLTI